jgi:hypothetical protein
LITGIANILAREARMDAVHSSGVFGWIEQPDIPFPHVQSWEPSVCGSFSEDLAGVWLPFNSDNWLMSEDEVCEQSSTSSCE